jgi:rhamnosyltransferase
MSHHQATTHDTPPIKQEEIAAVVVLYHPDDSVFDNLNSYAQQVSAIFAIDNTEKNQSNTHLREALRKNEKIIYLPNNENLGIAKALNIGAQCALKSGYKFLLTMDQDSTASPTMIADLVHAAAGEALNTVGILSPFHSTTTDPHPSTDKTTEVLTAWTSGSLLHLAAYKETGPFTEELFIDFVDHEYCLRLNLAGYKILKVNKAVLTHNIGNLKQHRLLWKYPTASNHSALRRYYITRNRFYIASQFKNKFPEFFREDLLIFLKELVVILLFENERLQKYKMILRGFYDYKKGFLGKYQDVHQQDHSCPPPRLS